MDKIIVNKKLDSLYRCINLAVHNYHDLNWDIVFAVASKHLEDFKEFAQKVSGHLN